MTAPVALCCFALFSSGFHCPGHWSASLGTHAASKTHFMEIFNASNGVKTDRRLYFCWNKNEKQENKKINQWSSRLLLSFLRLIEIASGRAFLRRQWYVSFQRVQHAHMCMSICVCVLWKCRCASMQLFPSNFNSIWKFKAFRNQILRSIASQTVLMLLLHLEIWIWCLESSYVHLNK